MAPSPTRMRPNGTPPAGAAHDLLHYRLSERLGQEELVTVYRATHLTLDRPVQIRVLRRTDWISVSRFQLAGKLAARLSHANLLPVIDAGHDERYGDYIVTPQLDARPLTELLAEGPLEPLVVLRIVAQLGAVLDYLHSQGIIHRDVQPANIYVTPQGTAYLSNLSLAAAPEAPDFSGIEDADYLTAYAPPEQSLTDGQPSPALDVYALGMVLYHALSGALPPRGTAEPPTLAERNAELAAVDRVVRRMIAIPPAQRYPSAGQAVAALRQALRQQLDAATSDMEEGHWEASAEWLENPLETIAGDVIESEFLTQSRARADTLHRVDAIRRLLDRWSRAGLMRRPLLGQIIQPEQIVSYNVYTYELRVQYEVRGQPTTRQSVYRGSGEPFGREFERWAAPVPDAEPFIDVTPEVIVIPGSQQVISCPECRGAQRLPCKMCAGKGTIPRTRSVNESDGSAREETFHENCPTCRGYGRQDCVRCEATGQLLEEKTFIWSRRGTIYFEEDDISGLDRKILIKKAQEVYRSPIELRDGRWLQIAPLKALMEAALAGGGEDARPIAAELVVRGVPVTEVDYRYRDRPHTLAVIGFDNTVRGDAALYDLERILLYAVILVMAILLAALIFLR
ncbi:MAG TPA: protein kinase [Roseiflexaceae bacterium]|nr:protein kinase [Roseiflexaceae bacterium]